MQSSQLLVRVLGDTTTPSLTAPEAQCATTDPAGIEEAWRDSSIELVQGLDVTESSLETLPGEFQAVFTK